MRMTLEYTHRLSSTMWYKKRKHHNGTGTNHGV